MKTPVSSSEPVSTMEAEKMALTPSTSAGDGAADEEKGLGEVHMAGVDDDTDENADGDEQLRALYEQHVHDFNFPRDMLMRAAALLAHSDKAGPADAEPEPEPERSRRRRALLAEFRARVQLAADDSPYAEVRAAVDPTDDPATPANTARAWLLGTVLAVLGTGVDQFFSICYPGVWVQSYVAQLLAYPCGVFLARVLPTKPLRLGRGYTLCLNPGPFNQKEHMVITIMSNVAYGGYAGTAYVTHVIQVLELDMFYGNAGLAGRLAWQVLLVVSTQLVGYGAAGITRRVLVYPPGIIWPACLAQIALGKALHHDDGPGPGPDEAGPGLSRWAGVSRFRFFLYAFAAMFAYFWLPNYLFTALSTLNWPTWLAPGNVTLAIVAGSVCGLGFNPFPTLDWNQASYLLDPIVTPVFAASNTLAGMVLAVAIVLPIYWTNTLGTAYLPINSNHVFDNTGGDYNISRVLGPDYTLDEDAYRNYSAPYLSAAGVVVYAACFATYSAAMVHVLLYNRHDIAAALRSVWSGRGRPDGDVHNRLMARYAEVPEWWYLALLAVSLAMACCCAALWDTTMPVWAVFVAVALCFALQVPVGIILATTNVQVTIDVLLELIGGYMLSGRPVANMLFKSYGGVACSQSINFSADLKLAHYCKIPPRLTFAVQTWATLVGAFVSIGVNQWQMDNIVNVCAADQPDKFSCPETHSLFTSTVVWGAIGPRRLLSAGQMYHPLSWGFLAGAVLPVPFFLLQRRYPGSWVRYVHVPVLLYGMVLLAPYNLTQMWPGFCLCVVFNHIKTRALGWWQKYAYVLSSALAAGMAVSGIVAFLAVQLHSVDLDWWGNRVSVAGVDGGGSSSRPCVLRQIPPGGF